VVEGSTPKDTGSLNPKTRRTITQLTGLITINSTNPRGISPKAYVKAPEYKLLRIEREITEAVEIETNIDMVRKHLEAIKTFAKVGERVNKRTIYFKRKYINYSTAIQVHDENIMIREVTDGLTAKQYISKYLPKESK
jgi:hypothetical protein